MKKVEAMCKYSSHDIFIVSELISPYRMGRILLSIGACLFALGKIEACQENLEAAREQLTESNGISNEWPASISIKLADCKTFLGKYGEAQ